MPACNEIREAASAMRSSVYRGLFTSLHLSHRVGSGHFMRLGAEKLTATQFCPKRGEKERFSNESVFLTNGNNVCVSAKEREIDAN